MNRRDFLKILGGGLGVLVASKIPIPKEEKPSLNLDEVAAKNYNVSGATANYWYGAPLPYKDSLGTSSSEHDLALYSRYDDKLLT